jgi:hypothetical protein
MLILRGGNWPEHGRWCLATALLAAAAVAWYAVEGLRTGELPGGSSPPGLAFGFLGGGIIIFEMLLWARKRVRSKRTLAGVPLGRATVWMKAHLWLGTLCLPLIVLHSGFHWYGGALGGVLMFVFLGVIFSGFWGLFLQQYLPKLMLDQVPAETIHSQVRHTLDQLHDEARRLVDVTCGREGLEPVAVGPDAGAGGREPGRTFLVVGAVRESGPFQGKFLKTRSAARAVPGSEPLLTFFDGMVVPYLLAKDGSRLPLASPKRAASYFHDVRTRLDPAAHDAVDAIRDICDQRRQFDLQARLHAWLHGWLLVHLPLSVAMFVLMVVHIYLAMKYL